MQGSSYTTAPEVLKSFISYPVQDIFDACERKEVRLTSILLHGSLAMGCFYVSKSDIHLLVVVDNFSQSQSAAFYDPFERHHHQKPYVGGLEASVVRSREAQKPVHPMPLLLYLASKPQDLHSVSLEPCRAVKPSS